MKFGVGLLLIGTGAILAWAVTTNTSVFNLHTAGYIIMLVGILGLVLPRRATGWVGRRLFVRRYERRPDGTRPITYPSYVTRVRPGLPAARSGDDAEKDQPADETDQPGETKIIEDVYEQ